MTEKLDELIKQAIYINGWNAAIERAIELLTELNKDGYLTDELEKLKK